MRRTMSALQETASLLSLWLRKNQVSKYYDLISTHHVLTEKSLYLNLGYWDGSTTYDDACMRLAEVLGEAGGMSRTDEVVDCGFGFADQDFYWLERFKPKRITGLNITASQVIEARRRAAERGFSADRLDLREGSATAMALPDASADLVIALDPLSTSILARSSSARPSVSCAPAGAWSRPTSSPATTPPARSRPRLGTGSAGAFVNSRPRTCTAAANTRVSSLRAA